MSGDGAITNAGHSATFGALATALAKAQAKMAGAAKDSINPHFKSKYADLASIWDACRAALSANEIAVLQPVSADGPSVGVTTLLAHSSGEWIAETLTLTALQNTPQAIGSAITYGRRYGLASMVGVAPEDDDGESAQARGSNSYSVAAPSRPEPDVRHLGSPGIAPLSPGFEATQHGEEIPADGQLYIARVDKSDTKNKNVKKFLVTFSDGRQASTIKDRLGAQCEQWCQDREAVTFEATESRFGLNLVSVKRAGSERADYGIGDNMDEPPLLLDEPPF